MDVDVRKWLSVVADSVIGSWRLWRPSQRDAGRHAAPVLGKFKEFAMPASPRGFDPFAHPLTLTPTPVGDPLVLQFGCLSGTPFPWPHRIWIDRHWVVTPFDEVSFQRRGHLSCLLAAEKATYAARHGLDLEARCSPPAIVGSQTGWLPLGLQPSPREHMLHREAHSSPLPAAAESRSPSTLALRFGADRRMVTLVLDAVQNAYGGVVQRPATSYAARECIREPEGIGWLWDAGVPPEFVAIVHAREGLGAAPSLLCVTSRRHWPSAHRRRLCRARPLPN